MAPGLKRGIGIAALGCGVLMVVGAFLAQGAGAAGLVVVTFAAGLLTQYCLNIYKD